MLENLGHKDFQCCFPIHAQQVMTFFHAIINDIRSGKSFISEVDYPGYIHRDYMVRFMDAIEDGRPVLRLLIPNVDGEYKGGAFEEQLRP